MRLSTLLAFSTVLGGVLVAVACGGDGGGGPATPQTLLAAAGDTQSGLTETQLPIPLRVRLLGSDGHAFKGATVTWSVTSGVATLGSVSSVTDDTGSASTTVTLGFTAGQVAIRATVPSLTPVTFTETACDYPPITPGTPIAGALATTDCRFGGYYTDFYSLDLTGGGQQEISVYDSSSAFDAYLELYTFAGDFVGFNDDYEPQVSTHSRIDAILAPGNYLIAPSSYDKLMTGVYRVSVLPRARGLAGCDGVNPVYVTRGVIVADSVTTTDCGNAVTGYYDVVAIFAKQGSLLRMWQRSTALNAKLRLLNFGGTQVAFNDDSAAGNTTAYLAFTALQSDLHLLQIGTSTPGETGAYTLEISSATTLSSAPAPTAPRSLLAAPWRRPYRRVW